MLHRLVLKNIGPAPEMVLDLGSRLNLITGDNGLGKSFLLDVTWWALTRRWPQDLNSKMTSGYAARPTDPKKPAAISFELDSKTKKISYTSTYSAADQGWIGKAGRPWNPGLVTYAHSDGGFSVWDPARNYWKKQGNADVQERLPGYVFSPKEVWDGLKLDVNGKETIVCNGLLADWTGWIRENGKPAKRIAHVLKSLSPSQDAKDLLVPGPLVRMGTEDVRDMPSLKTGYSDGVPILHASSGVRRVVALAYILLWNWQEHWIASNQRGEAPTSQVVMLIDELESHLHPRWQRSILAALLNLAQILHPKAKIQIITATHSPLVMASAEPTFNTKTDAWFDLDLEAGGKVEMRKREFVRLGDVARWLTSEAFDLKEPRSLEAEEAITKALELLKKPKVSDDEVAAVDRMLKAALGDIDRFWVRWSEFRDRREAAK